ncbi:hypothetical protein BJ165DRAFT_138216 [Panaeolus papilionaceus]|nr:hypothetical protein BJ165DRAFT_138216 [Panaeolus papilionaceus]
MKDCMFSYAKERWNQVFEFEYKGLQTVPLDKKPKKPVQAFDKLLLLNEAYTSEEDVEKWMNAELFKRDDTRFPAYMRSDLYDDLRDHIFRYSSRFTPKDANFWYEPEYSQEFIDPSADKRDVKHYGLFVYGNGFMALDKMDGSTEGVRMERLFVYYLGIVSSFVPLEW